MALFDDIMTALSGATGVAVGSQMLTAPAVSTTRNFVPGASSAEEQNLQLAQAIQLANLQQAGFVTTRDAAGNLTLTPRDTVESMAGGMLPGTLLGLQSQLGQAPISQLGGTLNRQALAGATGRPQLDREGLIRAIQQRQAPQQQQSFLQGGGQPSFGGISPITVGPVSTNPNFSGMPSTTGTSGGGGGFLGGNLPAIAGGTLGSLALLNKLFPSALPAVGRGITSTLGSLFGAPNTSPLTQNEQDFAQFMDRQAEGDFESNWYWIPDDEFSASFASTADVFPDFGPTPDFSWIDDFSRGADAFDLGF